MAAVDTINSVTPIRPSVFSPTGGQTETDTSSGLLHEWHEFLACSSLSPYPVGRRRWWWATARQSRWRWWRLGTACPGSLSSRSCIAGSGAECHGSSHRMEPPIASAGPLPGRLLPPPLRSPLEGVTALISQQGFYARPLIHSSNY